jgi:hypothetical protein
MAKGDLPLDGVFRGENTATSAEWQSNTSGDGDGKVFISGDDVRNYNDWRPGDNVKFPFPKFATVRIESEVNSSLYGTNNSGYSWTNKFELLPGLRCSRTLLRRSSQASQY